MELEFLARDVRRISGVQEDEFPYAAELAVRFIGHERAVLFAPRLVVPACLRETEAGYQILVRPDVLDINFHVAHELGHVAVRVLTRKRLSESDEERAANYFAAAVLAPPSAVARARRHYGERIRPLAKAFGLSQTSAVLRIAEVEQDDRAVVTKTGNVLLRSAGRVSWQSVPVVDFARGRAQVPGLAKRSLRGGIDEGRVAVRVR